MAKDRVRDYKEEYNSYHAKPEQKKNRALRNAARDKMEDAGRVSKGDGKDVHHKKAVRHGGANGPGNLAVATPAKHRGWNKGT